MYVSRELAFVPVFDIATKWANIITAPYLVFWMIKMAKYLFVHNNKRVT